MKFIETNEDLSVVREAISQETVVALDTEFMREIDISPLLCLLQIATSNEVFLIDPISVDVLLLKQLLESSGVKKIFHDARQDIEIFRLRGINIENYYDTQLAEMLLSVKESESYRSLVQKYIGKKLRKVHTLSDWAQRPLSKSQIRYASEDVYYLREIYEKQITKLRQLNRENWLESAIVMEEDRVNQNWFSLLNNWRGEKAKIENILPEQVVHTKLISAVCRKGLDFVKKLQNSRDMDQGKFVNEFLAYASTVVECIPKANPAPNDVVCYLHALLHVCARRNSICPSMIARRTDLELLAKGEGSKSMSLQGWRFEVFGQYALKLLSGEISLSVKNNEVEIR